MLRPLAQSFGRMGGDPDAFLAALGIGEGVGVDAFVPGRRVVEVLEGLSRRIPGRSIGLSLAQASPIGSLGFFDYLIVTSASLREALSRMTRFFGLVTQLVSLVFEERDGFAHAWYRVRPGTRHVTQLTEFSFAAFVARARQTAAPVFRLESVTFTHEVADPRPFEDFFGARVRFGAAVDELTFDAGALDVPLTTADPATAASIEEYAARLHAKLAPGDPFGDRVRAAIATGLHNRKADLASVARALHVSTRTLQRQLEAHGFSHRDLVNDVRRELAEQLLARENASVIEVAYELGFTQQAAFHRAFVRWTGLTPGAFRAKAKP